MFCKESNKQKGWAVREYIKEFIYKPPGRNARCTRQHVKKDLHSVKRALHFIKTFLRVCRRARRQNTDTQTQTQTYTQTHTHRHVHTHTDWLTDRHTNTHIMPMYQPWRAGQRGCWFWKWWLSSNLGLYFPLRRLLTIVSPPEQMSRSPTPDEYTYELSHVAHTNGVMPHLWVMSHMWPAIAYDDGIPTMGWLRLVGSLKL